MLRPLVEECLDDDPAVRPTIATVCKRIQESKDDFMKESPQGYITLYQQLEQLRKETEQQRNENEQQSTMIAELRTTIDQVASNKKLLAILHNVLFP